MPSAFSVSYRFSQRLPAPAEEAYRWCTTYGPGDVATMGLKGRRKVERISEDALILADTLLHSGESVTKKKLVRLYPIRRSWTSTHISGPNRHSQFWYEILPEGRSASRLVFTGLAVFYNDVKMGATERSLLTQRERKSDAATWRILAREMGYDLKKHK